MTRKKHKAENEAMTSLLPIARDDGDSASIARISLLAYDAGGTIFSPRLMLFRFLMIEIAHSLR